MSTQKTTYSVKRYRRDKGKPDATLVIRNCLIERVKVLDAKLRYHVNARAGGTSVLIRHDDYHGISTIIRTPKLKRGGYGSEVTTYALDGDNETEYDRESILHIIADRIESGYYAEPESAAEGKEL